MNQAGQRIREAYVLTDRRVTMSMQPGPSLVVSGKTRRPPIARTSSHIKGTCVAPAQTKELEEHLRAALSMLTKRDVTITTLESRLAAAQQENENYRQRLATVIQRVVARQRRAESKLPTKRKTIARASRPSRPKNATYKRSRRFR